MQGNGEAGNTTVRGKKARQKPNSNGGNVITAEKYGSKKYPGICYKKIKIKIP